MEKTKTKEGILLNVTTKAMSKVKEKTPREHTINWHQGASQPVWSHHRGKTLPSERT